jgi:hypothetical protein
MASSAWAFPVRRFLSYCLPLCHGAILDLYPSGFAYSDGRDYHHLILQFNKAERTVIGFGVPYLSVTTSTKL